MKVTLFFANGGKMVEEMENIVIIQKVEAINDHRHDLRNGKLLVLSDALSAFRAVKDPPDEWR